jgi:hypothetical protein
MGKPLGWSGWVQKISPPTTIQSPGHPAHSWVAILTTLSQPTRNCIIQYILWYFCEFLMYLPLILHGRPVWCYFKKIKHLFTRYMFFVLAVHWYKVRHASTGNTAVCSVTHKFICVCSFSKQFSIYRLILHFLHIYRVLQFVFPVNIQELSDLYSSPNIVWWSNREEWDGQGM